MTEKPLWARVVGWLGLAGHAFLFFWYVASGLLAPMWAVIGLLVVWMALLAAASRLLRTRPALVPLVPAAAFLLWVAVISAGEAWLGWTA
ncbi:MAG TPA: hypothetical protein VFX60_03300 [Micromonospora sp.]|nr:hypothetical protein [Micromonospora sp.]